MVLLRLVLLASLIAIPSAALLAQTPTNLNHFAKDGVSFDYPPGWTLQDESNSDAQTIKMGRKDGDITLTVFVHRGRITAEKMADAQKAFINPYIEATVKQFVEGMGAKVERKPDNTEIGGVPAEGVLLKFSVTGDSATSQIYWALVGQRVVILTYFGPDRDRKKFLSSWDAVRTTMKVEEPKPAAKPSPKP